MEYYRRARKEVKVAIMKGMKVEEENSAEDQSWVVLVANSFELT